MSVEPGQPADTSSPGSEKTWSIRIHRDWRPLELAWRELEERGHASVFQSYDWIAPWYQSTTTSGLAEAVVVEISGTGRSQPVMLLPLALHREKRLRTITFADLGVSDYAMPVMAPDLGLTATSFAGLWALVLDALPPCDLVRIRKIPQQLRGVPNPLATLEDCTPFAASAYGIPLGMPFEQHAREVMGRKKFVGIRSKWNQLNEIAPVALETCQGSEATNALFDVFVAQRQARFRELGRADIFDDPLWHGFYRDVVRGTHGRPAAMVCALVAGGSPVATSLNLVFKNTILNLAQGFVPGPLDRFSPGILLHYRLMNWAAEHGLSYYDLTVGDEPYKRHIGSTEQPLFEWMAPRSAIGKAAFGLWQGKRLLDRMSRRTE